MSRNWEKKKMEDLFDAKFGKHDYDWLLSPPETPSKHQPSTTTPNGRSSTRSVSTTRASRLSAPNSENSTSTRPVRSSSVTRPSISNSYSISSSIYNNRTSALNGSLASVPSQPGNQGKHKIKARPSPTSRPSPARSSTPVRTRPLSTSAGVKTARPQRISPPSTPTSIPQIPTNLKINANTLASRHSRPSTPTRRPLAPTIVRSRSVGQIPKRTVGLSSPAPRAQLSMQPSDLPDFHVDAPPKLTKLPERPGSVGRTRQGAALTAPMNSKLDMTSASSCLNRRHSLPAVSQVMFLETSPKASLCSNGHDSEGTFPRPNKVATATDSSRFGRTIARNSLDMASRHMDTRQGMGGIRGASIFPHSIHSAPLKCRSAHKPDPVFPVMIDKEVADDDSYNGTKENGSCNGVNPSKHKTLSDNDDVAANRSPSIARENNVDLFGSYRYDTMLLQEDSENMSWLHSIEDNSEQSPLFDHKFESLLEPFGIL